MPSKPSCFGARALIDKPEEQASVDEAELKRQLCYVLATSASFCRKMPKRSGRSKSAQ